MLQVVTGPNQLCKETVRGTITISRRGEFLIASSRYRFCIFSPSLLYSADMLGLSLGAVWDEPEAR